MSGIRLEVVPASGIEICGICNRAIFQKPVGIKQVNVGIGMKYLSYHPDCFKEKYKVFLIELMNT